MPYRGAGLATEARKESESRETETKKHQAAQRETKYYSHQLNEKVIIYVTKCVLIKIEWREKQQT